MRFLRINRPWIIWRALFVDSLRHALLGLFVITLLLIVQNLLRFLDELVGSGIGLLDLARLMAAILPAYLSYALPTALLFGVLLTFGRMSADGEVVGLRASGISVARMLPPILALGAVCAGLTAWLLFDLEPRSRAQMKQLVRQMGSTVHLLEPGRFRRLGERVFFVREIGDESCPLRGLLISDFSRNDRPGYVSARCASVQERDAGGSLRFELTDGSIDFKPLDADVAAAPPRAAAVPAVPADAKPLKYRRVHFESMTIDVDLSRYIGRRSRPKDFTLAELYELDRRVLAGQSTPLSGDDPLRRVQAQIQRRLAFPFAPLLLAIVAVPLGIRPVRSGRSAGALTALAVMGIYWCLAAAGEIAGENGYVPVGVGAWAPNLVVAVIALILMQRIKRADT